MKNTKKAVLLLTFVCGLFSHAAAFAVQQGCFNASEGDVRAFSFLAGASDTMTIETCRCEMVLARNSTLVLHFLVLCCQHLNAIAQARACMLVQHDKQLQKQRPNRPSSNTNSRV